MTCVICKHGDTRDGRTTVTLERGATTVIIRDVSRGDLRELQRVLPLRAGYRRSAEPGRASGRLGRRGPDSALRRLGGPGTTTGLRLATRSWARRPRDPREPP